MYHQRNSSRKAMIRANGALRCFFDEKHGSVLFVSRSSFFSESEPCLKETVHPLLNTLTCWWPSPWRVGPYAREASGRESRSCATSGAPPSCGQCPFFGRSERSEVGKASCKERATPVFTIGLR